MEIELWQLAIYFFGIAVIYSAAGFGGGSSYLALLAISGLPFQEIRMLALLCNITVVTGSVYLTWKEGLLSSKRIIPLVLLSVPLSYLGGTLRISQDLYFDILGVTLLIASLIMLLIRTESAETSIKKLSKYSNGLIGGGIGFLSGLVGIGGGIFLSPILYISKWGRAKTIAATTALFILVNSISGLAGQMYTHGWSVDSIRLIVLLVAVFVGGQIGIRLTISKLNPLVVRRITALVIMFVAIRLLFFS